MTGQPFMVNYYASKLKKTFPQIPLVNDFRDAWNEGLVKKYRLFRSIGLGYQLKALMKAILSQLFQKVRKTIY